MAAEFAHPIEQALAKVFDAHGITWQYEPHTFVLERDENGDVRQAFTPDFFLPDLDLYVECTVMRQSLTSRKRRKARLTRERIGADVAILFRRDFQRLARRWGLPELDVAGPPENDVSSAAGAGTETPGMSEARTLETGEAFRVNVDQRPEEAVVTVSGDLDLHSAPVLRGRLAALTDASIGHIVLDLSEATFLDSMALGVILAAQKRLAAARGRLDLVVETPEIRRIFEITMLDQVFELHDTRAAAIDANGGPPS